MANLVIRVLRDQLAHRVIEDPQGFQVHQETEGNQDLRATSDPLDQLDQMDFKDSLVSKEQLVEQVCQAILGHLDPPGLPVIEERQALLGMLALQAPTDSLDLKDHKVIKDFLDHRDLQGSLAQSVLLDR